jgi:hypothetical protein
MIKNFAFQCKLFGGSEQVFLIPLATTNNSIRINLSLIPLGTLFDLQTIHLFHIL